MVKKARRLCASIEVIANAVVSSTASEKTKSIAASVAYVAAIARDDLAALRNAL
ncbi:hypothetical protein GXB81_24865 [Paraburkholderia sp. Ac-20336]|uniref:hypothetical protein n=1 Tax=Burkholderiaceae TaxID=119060 RepID=UPI00142191EB|nr:MULTISPECIES: hypothetical protein [Burkholderiaceae]MBN3806263.1 hypothetical protein [Paraburkholderia sp. Ac-20336]MBN3848375.1 hypothetical protein [Paraburkholderia sp. Ac-20342]